MKKTLIITTILLLAGTAVAFGVWQYQSQKTPEPEEPVGEEPQEPQLSLEERFVEAYYETDYPDTEMLDEPPEITGNEEADDHIRSLAEERGYRLQRVPAGELTDFQGVSVQSQLVNPWEDLQEAAIKEGIYLGLVSGHRSPENQREIFLTQLREQAIESNGSGFTNSQIAAGEADAVIDNILSEYSIPGYSKHHSGYVIDITDTASDKPFEEFAETDGYDWVVADDYANIRAHGFVPSYPEGVDKLGPDPEPWEYAWIGPSAEDL